MDTKEKVSTLIEMGFTVDEAISLAKGNYRTVPDPKQEPGSDPKQEPGSDPKQEPESDPKQKPGSDPKHEPGSDPKQEPGNDSKQNEPLERIEQALAKLTQSVINSNINNKQQPAPQTTQDVLGLMLEPAKPEERSN